MMDWRQRLTHRMDELGLTQAELSRRAGIKKTMLHDVLQRGMTPSVANLFKIAQALNLTLTQLYEGGVDSPSTIRLSGVYEGGIVFDPSRLQGESTTFLPMLEHGFESIRIRADNLEVAGYRRGDTVCGNRIAAAHAHNIVGKDCIVGLPDGSRHICQLTKGSSQDRYTLRFFNRSSEPVEDVEIAWAAPITMILRD